MEISKIQQLQMRAPSEDWVQERANYLGGTDIAAILGVHKWRTPLCVYRDKNGLTPPVVINQSMVHGQNLELYVAQCYSRLTGRKLHKSRFCRDKHVPYFAVNPDYETRGERPVRLVECKTAGAFMKDEWGEEGDAVPDQYLLQCMWQLAITGKQIVDLAVLIGGQDLRIYTIERDEDLIAHIRSEAMNWWETYMLSQTPPPISGMKPDTEYVNSEFSNSIEQVVYADPELDDLCIALRDARLAVNQADEYKTKLENDIKLRMKEASVLESSVGKITWKNTANGGSRRFVPKFKEVSTICPQPVAA